MSLFPKVLLVQAREKQDPMLKQELLCFKRQSKLPLEHFTTFNFPEASNAPDASLFDAVLIGGAGDFSFAKVEFGWENHFFALMKQLIDCQIPTLASCFGFQGIMKYLGSEIVQNENTREVGSFLLELTKEGKKDPLFESFPDFFWAQEGHLDAAMQLPENCLLLASNANCPLQAIKLKEAPFWATQFHPELSKDEHFERYMTYLKSYQKPEQSLEELISEAKTQFKESPETTTLVARFFALSLFLSSTRQ